MTISDLLGIIFIFPLIVIIIYVFVWAIYELIYDPK